MTRTVLSQPLTPDESSATTAYGAVRVGQLATMALPPFGQSRNVLIQPDGQTSCRTNHVEVRAQRAP